MAQMGSLSLLFVAFLLSAVHAASIRHNGGMRQISSAGPRQHGRRLSQHLNQQSQGLKALADKGKLPTWDPLVGRGSPFIESSTETKKGSRSSVSSFGATAAPPAPSNEGYKTTEEVTKPIQRPRGVTPCTVSILTQEPFYTYDGDVPVSYSPPSACNGTWQLVVVTVAAQVTGVQFDRRFAFYLDNVPLVVSTTAEPAQNPGVIFKVERDLTSYSSFFKSSHGGHVVLQNPVDSTYTGIYYVNVTIQFYPGAAPPDLPNVILPVGDSATLTTSTTFTAPSNAYKAAVELYISHYGNEEFYFDDVPRSYYNSLPSYLQPFFATGTAFREIVALLDGSPVGVIFPKAVFYAGALDPRLWSPFMGIGSLHMLQYTLDITPFVGLLVDGKPHSLTFNISYTESTSMWIITGAIKIWKDPKLTNTRGGVISRTVSGNSLKETVTNPGDLNTNITTWASRSYQFSGFVLSSFGRITTNVTASLSFENIIRQYNDFTALGIHQETQANNSVVTQVNDVLLNSVTTSSRFPVDLTQELAYYWDGSYASSQGVSHGVHTSATLATPKYSQSNSVDNEQSVQSVYRVTQFYDLLAYSQSTAQSYEEKAKTSICPGCRDQNSCYGRDVASQWSWSDPVLSVNVTQDSARLMC